MTIAGRKPKPPGMSRNRTRPTHDWTEVVNVPNDAAPRLPPTPRRPAPEVPPEPPRPLGRDGLALWDRAWAAAHAPLDADQLLQLCEQVDERATLRFAVLRDGDWRERNGLRMLDTQVTAGLVKLADTQVDDVPRRWPAATKRWWTAVSRLPHTILWSEADWQFAMDTALLVASFHVGTHRLAAEIRQREKIMGTTADARRDLRIRYVDPAPVTDEADPSVTAMADYRRSVQA